MISDNLGIVILSLILIGRFNEVFSSEKDPPPYQCKPRDYGNGSPVCVCDSDYCDTVGSVEPVPDGAAVIFTSSKEGQRFQRNLLKWTKPKKGKKLKDQDSTNIHLSVNFSIKYQAIEGFGGAFTDSFGLNMASLPDRAQRQLLKAYFGSNGIRYNIGRIPIASCDFSLSNYSYDDVIGDFELKQFSLTKYDLIYKIPLIKEAQTLGKNSIKLFGSPWSAPGWMKTSGKMQGNGTIIGQPGGKYYKSYAQYLVKFLQAYERNGVKIWGLTVENEPTEGYHYNYSFQATGFTAELERDFVKSDLGPALNSAGYRDLKLMVLDDQRVLLPKWAEVVFNDTEAAKYVTHIAVHWYGNFFAPINILDHTHERFPNVPILGTEACSGYISNTVILGSWERGEDYATDIIQTLNHWYTGWVDWNLALNLEGGPNWVRNFVDSPIIVNATAGEFYKQPMFYAMGHFSTFLPRDSVRVNFTAEPINKEVEITSFYTPDQNKVVIFLNKNDHDVSLTLQESGNDDKVLNVKAPKRSLSTILWK